MLQSCKAALEMIILMEWAGLEQVFTGHLGSPARTQHARCSHYRFLEELDIDFGVHRSWSEHTRVVLLLTVSGSDERGDVAAHRNEELFWQRWCCVRLFLFQGSWDSVIA